MIFPTRSQAPQSDALTYEPYFGLKEKPFSLNADLRFLFDSPSHAASLKSLLGGIRRREALLVLTGEIGMGKTMLCRSALRNLGRKTFYSFVPDPFTSPEDLLKTLLIDFGAVSIGELTSGSLKGTSRTELSYLLAGYLDTMIPLDAYVVVIIDEAQNLSGPMIEATRMLCDSCAAPGRLQIVFVGQLELHERLKSPEMRQVDQRISGYTRLEPLSREVVTDYIQHRLVIAGGSSERVLFPPNVVDIIHRRSGGVPRLVNRVCDRALHVAHERQLAMVDPECLDAALSSIGSPTFMPTWASIVHAESPNGVHAQSTNGGHKQSTNGGHAKSTNGDKPVAAAPPPVSAPDPAPPGRISPRSTAASDQAANVPIPLVLDDRFLASIGGWASSAEVRDFPTEHAAPEHRDTDIPDPARPPANVTLPPRRLPIAPIIRNGSRGASPQVFSQAPVRVWPKRLGIAAATFGSVSAIALGGYQSPSLFSRFRQAPPPIETPAAPRTQEAATVAESPASPAPAPTPATPAAAASGENFVAVGLYATRTYAARVVATLTAGGFAAIHRPLELRGEAFEQVLLGPFLTRDEATTSLQRLRQLGGHDDARVIEIIPPSQ